MLLLIGKYLILLLQTCENCYSLVFCEIIYCYIVFTLWNPLVLGKELNVDSVH